ncbi:hypothetical protein GCM10009737_03750 [Nocardioides lentus]|uniref:Uncharacterized protein n=1 Tax=Nocardioides lentus TaxID=338077 RepID=A0ABN2NXC5_9ACTN
MRHPTRTSPRGRRRPSARRSLAAGLAALLAATSLALGTGPAASVPAGVEEPFGDPVEPGTSIAGATEVTTGTYVVPVPEPGQDHFFEIRRTQPGQVLWYGITADLEEPIFYGTLAATGIADGDETRTCNEGQISNLDGLSYLTMLASGNRSPDCRDAESVVVVVESYEIADEVVPTDGSYQLVVWTEPPTDPDDLAPGANENSRWTPVQATDPPRAVEGASTFVDAEPLADGTYRTTVRQGRAAVFAFPLTFGQHAQVEARIVEGARPEDSLDYVDAAWISPLGGQLRRVTPAGGPDPLLGLDGASTAGWSTPIVTYANRQRTGGVGNLDGRDSQAAAPAAFAGTYFLVLELPGAGAKAESYTDKMVLDLTVATITDYRGSAPAYVAEPPPLPTLDGSGYVATAAEEQAAREAAARPAPWLLVGGLFALAALLAVVGGIAVGRVLGSRAGDPR